MPKILSNLDLGKNELQNVVIQKLNSAPSNPIEGQIYYNTLSKNLYRYDGTNWVTYQADLNISGTTSVNTLSIDNAPTANSTNLVTSGGVYAAIAGADYIVPPSSPTSGDVLTYNGSNWGAASAPTEIFIAEYNATEYSDITAAINAGKIVFVHYEIAEEEYFPLIKIDPDNSYIFGSVSGSYYFELIICLELNNTTTWAHSFNNFQKPIKKASITTSTTWTGSSSPYTQTVTISGYTVTSNTKIDIQPDATALTTLSTAGTTQLFISNSNGTLTLYALGNKPTSALTLQVTCTEVS